MFKKWKKVIAAVLSSAMIITCGGCTMGKDTAYALTVDGYQVKAGVYIYYSAFLALSEAKSEAKNQDENINTDDSEALKKVTIDGKSFTDYLNDKSTEYCVKHVAIIKHFNELELSLTDDQKENISDYVDSEWDSSKDSYEKNGIGKDSLKEIMESNFKSSEIFKAYYGENGIEGITDEQLKNYYIENNARVRYIDMDLHDSEGNELDAAGKKEIKDMANDFLKRAKSAANEEKMLEEFNAFQEEYDKYVSDKAAEASGEEPETTTTAATTTSPTTTTTISAGDIDKLKEEAEKLNDEYEKLKEEAENADEDAKEEAEMKAEEAKNKAEEAKQAAEEAENAQNTSETTTAPENEDSEETTTTTSIHENESIIHVVTTDENTKEEDINYTPSKKSYDWIFNDAKTGVPEIIEDDETIYVMVKFDIEDRVNEDDLWSDYNVENVRSEMFYDKMQDTIKGWGEEYEVVKNEKAYEKYNPFDVKFEY